MAHRFLHWERNQNNQPGTGWYLRIQGVMFHKNDRLPSVSIPNPEYLPSSIGQVNTTVFRPGLRPSEIINLLLHRSKVSPSYWGGPPNEGNAPWHLYYPIFWTIRNGINKISIYHQKDPVVFILVSCF